MAPSSTDGSEIAYILDALALLGEVKPDWTALAAQKGISHRNGAYRKFRDCLKKHGFSYENGQIARLGEDTGVGTEAPKKAPPKKLRRKAEPAPKKRKLQVDDDGNSNEDEMDEENEPKEGA